ncbi:uncharacterized protein LOC133892996 [Phragmites australis]|uniref:uncharacterized protein LOC133892996 n=1 Tax=Phragmites australis TaxID=29695 RepID=UPI002D78C163|nr:uncharacterized protein LOC133892996 [Phragmites australis]
MSTPAEASTPNTRRKRWCLSTSASAPDPSADFPASFHVPSRRSIRCCLPAQPTEFDGMMSVPAEASIANTHRKRRQPAIASSAPVAQRSVRRRTISSHPNTMSSDLHLSINTCSPSISQAIQAPFNAHQLYTKSGHTNSVNTKSGHTNSVNTKSRHTRSVNTK